MNLLPVSVVTAIEQCRTADELIRLMESMAHKFLGCHKLKKVCRLAGLVSYKRPRTLFLFGEFLIYAKEQSGVLSNITCIYLPEVDFVCLTYRGLPALQMLSSGKQVHLQSDVTWIMQSQAACRAWIKYLSWVKFAYRYE